MNRGQHCCTRKPLGSRITGLSLSPDSQSLIVISGVRFASQMSNLRKFVALVEARGRRSHHIVTIASGLARFRLGPSGLRVVVSAIVSTWEPTLSQMDQRKGGECESPSTSTSPAALAITLGRSKRIPRAAELARRTVEPLRRRDQHVCVTHQSSPRTTRHAKRIAALDQYVVAPFPKSLRPPVEFTEAVRVGGSREQE